MKFTNNRKKMFSKLPREILETLIWSHRVEEHLELARFWHNLFRKILLLTFDSFPTKYEQFKILFRDNI